MPKRKRRQPDRSDSDSSYKHESDTEEEVLIPRTPNKRTRVSASHPVDSPVKMETPCSQKLLTALNNLATKGGHV
ncbi:hypothetical protein M408DRAFT_326734 [Serendipita vermifera MAFF 305830]|uniref:Uncharacterized protein n=1 Tax=Serendipita vermifera MAFF 305830 TaxID=933852 RepID=A0A0C3BM07_SERVB|nr:hypothetical protein M408DRAFT_326734 [Serendipita vermifera MAFF 305830]